MKVLVACEESQRVCIAFREKGHEAYSCDIIDCSGCHPEWHIKKDVIEVLDGYCNFKTCDGETHHIYKWDLIIAFPPCTYLTITGNRWFDIDKYGSKALDRMMKREEAFIFFMQFVFAECDHIAIENPIGYMNSHYRKPDQIIQPWQFGENQRKSTCLWLKNLPLLKPTNIVKPEIVYYKNGKGTDNPWHVNTLGLPKEERSKIRSKTFPGIARAMAEQWGNIIER